MVRLQKSQEFRLEKCVGGVRKTCFVSGLRTHPGEEIEIEQSRIDSKPVVIPTAHQFKSVLFDPLDRKIAQVPIQQNRDLWPIIERDVL